MTKSSATHNKAGRAKVGAHDSVASCCVMVEEAMRSRQTRLGTRDRPWARKTEMRARHGNSIATENSLSRQTWTVTRDLEHHSFTPLNGDFIS